MAARTPPPEYRVVQSTPALRKISSKKPFEVAKASAEHIKDDMAREMKGHWIGPCPLEHFFDSMHAPAEEGLLSTQPRIPATYFKDMRVSCEKDIYKSLTTLANGEGGYPPLLPEHSLVDTSNHPDPNSEEGAKIRPDLGHYKKDVVSKKHPTMLDLMLIAYEIKKYTTEDIVNDTMECKIPLPHDDCLAPYESTSNTSTRIRGQLANYATQICRRQHRTHFYMVFIFHPFVRFIRWDRAGAVVTKRTNYVEDCTPLVQFLHLFGRLDRAGKGFDPTVYPAIRAEAEEAKKHLARWGPKLERTVFKMHVPDTNDKTREFLVWGALADPESPLGRATRGYPAVEVVNGVVSSEPVFLKEQWRSIAVRPEVETLKELNAKGVRYVPTLLCGGDLPGQETKTHEISNDSWKVGHKRIDKRIHIRFVVAEVGQPLEQFPSSKVMLSAIHDAFQGHKEAYRECKIWHRDISGGNILILDSNQGLLSDWDLARKEADLVNGARAYERTGTWPFMSAGLLEQPNKQHTTRDDLESFFWVVLFYGLHYLPHTKRNKLAKLMTQIFEQYEDVESDGILRGGAGKLLVIGSGRYIGNRHSKKFYFTRCQPLTEFVFGGIDLLKGWASRFDPTTAEDSCTDWEEEEYVPVTHTDMESLWAKALQSSLWPQGDHAVDQIELQKKLDFIVKNERLPRPPTGKQNHNKRSDFHEPMQDEEEEEEESLRRKRRKTCHGSEAAHL